MVSATKENTKRRSQLFGVQKNKRFQTGEEMNQRYKKVAKAIETLQKCRADNGIRQRAIGFKTLFALRQSKRKGKEK